MVLYILYILFAGYHEPWWVREDGYGHVFSSIVVVYVLHCAAVACVCLCASVLLSICMITVSALHCVLDCVKSQCHEHII